MDFFYVHLVLLNLKKLLRKIKCNLSCDLLEK